MLCTMTNKTSESNCQICRATDLDPAHVCAHCGGVVCDLCVIIEGDSYCSFTCAELAEIEARADRADRAETALWLDRNK